MLTAICFSGEPRSIEYTHSNLRHSFDTYIQNYHIFGFLPECDNSQLLQSYFPDGIFNVQADRHIDQTGMPKETGFKTGAQKYLQQINGWKEVNLMRKSHEASKNIKYDYVMRCRMDIKFTTPLPEPHTLNTDRLYIPDFQQHGGLNDRFCVGTSDLMDVYMGTLDFFEIIPEECTHAESFLKFCLEAQDIAVEPSAVRFNRVLECGTELNDS